MWNSNDKKGFEECTQQQIGQINSNTNIGRYLEKRTKETSIGSSILEIGSWNGLGSTKVIADVLNDSVTFYSLEVNKDKLESGKRYYQDRTNIRLLHSTVIPYSLEMEQSIRMMFPYLNDEWFQVDLENLKQSSNFWFEVSKITNNNNNNNTSDPWFDWILLDGGEYTTVIEFDRLKEHTHEFILDDVLTSKCYLILQRIESGQYPNWYISHIDKSERNGWAIIKKRN